jgi:hypothetical protein
MYVREAVVWLGWALFYGRAAICAAGTTIVRWEDGAAPGTLRRRIPGPTWRQCRAGWALLNTRRDAVSEGKHRSCWPPLTRRVGSASIQPVEQLFCKQVV